MEKLICDNKICSNYFFRYPKNISRHNYCSRSCAVAVNNHFSPKRKKAIHACFLCGKTTSQRQKFCSLSCRAEFQRKYSRSELLKLIKNIGQELGRTPSRRELGSVSFACIREFGSWNKAIIAAKLNPHRSDSQKMYKRIGVRAKDGHKCDSISEAIIDNWLNNQGISHNRNVQYFGTNYKADWSIGSNIFVEYFGLAKDCSRYDISIKEKKRLAKKLSINLIEIYPKDLYPKIKLDKKLDFFKIIRTLE